MKKYFLEMMRLLLLALVLGACVREVDAQIVRSPLVSRLAAEREMIARRSASRSSESSTIPIRYSSSAQASNMVLPAIFLGAPTLVILALIIKAMMGD